MDDVENHRVQSHAAAAIINFTENCGKDILVPYLEPLLGKLVYLLLGGQRIVQEQVTKFPQILNLGPRCFCCFHAAARMYCGSLGAQGPKP